MTEQGFKYVPTPQMGGHTYRTHRFDGDLFGGPAEVTVTYHPDTPGLIDDVTAVPSAHGPRTARQLCDLWMGGLTQLWQQRPEDSSIRSSPWVIERAVLDCTGSPKDKIDLLAVLKEHQPQP